MAAAAVNVRRLFHCLALCAAILAFTYLTGASRVCALLRLVCHRQSPGMESLLLCSIRGADSWAGTARTNSRLEYVISPIHAAAQIDYFRLFGDLCVYVRPRHRCAEKGTSMSDSHSHANSPVLNAVAEKIGSTLGAVAASAEIAKDRISAAVKPSAPARRTSRRAKTTRRPRRRAVRHSAGSRGAASRKRVSRKPVSRGRKRSRISRRSR